MDQTTFDEFRKIIHSKSGIKLGDNKVALVSSRIIKRMRILRIVDSKDYLKYVLNDSTGNEIVHLLDVISTNVTSFFRESEHFDFTAQLIKSWHAAGLRNIRIWSAASSTGEEPYSIAMTISEAVDLRSNDIKILATDISTRVLDACKQGIYGAEKVASISRPLLEKYFYVDKGNPTSYQVKDSLKKMITFNRLNLSVLPYPMKGPFDLVFCRNVMIYFDAETRTQLLGEIFRLLRPGGYLMIGHAESLLGITSKFTTIRPSIYMKN